MAWDGQGGRNFAGPFAKQAGPRGQSSLDVVIEGGFLPITAGPVEYANWLRAPVDAFVVNLATFVSVAITDQLAPYIATVQAIGDAAQGADEHAEGEATAAQDFADTANTAASSATSSLASLLANKATVANIWVGTEDTKFVTSKTFADANAFVATVAGEISGGTVTFDMTKGFNRKHTLTQNTTLAAPTGMIDGATYTWMLIAGAGFTVAALPAIFVPGVAGAPSFNTAAGKVNKIIGQYDATRAKIDFTFWRE